MAPMMPVADALAMVLDGVAQLDTEWVELAEAHGRVLAEHVVALRTQPPCAVSAMDGYAVRAADIAMPPAQLTVIGSVAAGQVFDRPLGGGQAVRIFTGAPVPEGADTILIQEEAEETGDTSIMAMNSAEPGQFVRPAGLDFSSGDRLVNASTRLDAGHLSVAAAGNHPKLAVVRKPIVGILATGDELVRPGTPLGPGQIVASNTPGVAAIVAQAGGQSIDLGIADDRRLDLEIALHAAVAAKCDMLITLGGASVGDHDLVRPTFTAQGMQLGFHKIAMRPGKPMIFGQLGAMRVLGLPGNPVSSLVCTHLFVVPLIAALSGRSHQRHRHKAIVAHELAENGAREHYMRATLDRDQAGNLVATAFENQDSSILSHFAAADGLILRPVGAPAADAGSLVDVIMLREPTGL